MPAQTDRIMARSASPRAARRLLVPLLLVVLVFAFTASPTHAAEFIGDDNPTIVAGRTIDDDVYLAGNNALIAGVVTRDATVFSANLDVTGRVDGNLVVTANDVEIRGPIGRSVRAAVGDLRIAAPVGGDVLAAAGNVIVEPGGSVAGDIVAAGDVTVRGQVGGEIRVASDDVFIDAAVGGHVLANADRIRLGPNAQLARALLHEGGDPELAAGAAVAGATAERNFSDGLALGLPFGGRWLDVLRLLAALLSGLVIVLLLPRAAVATADALRFRPLPALLWGLAAVIGVPIALLVLLVSVIGLPLALVVLALFLAALYLSQVFVGLTIGRLLLNPTRFGGNASRPHNVLAMGIGVILLYLLRLLPIPVVPTIVSVATILLALGALALALAATLRRRPSRPSALP